MATIEELERFDADVRAAEVTAAEPRRSLREAVIAMPVESKLARTFARYAREFDYSSTRGHAELSGLVALQDMARDIAQDGRRDATAHLRAAMECLSPIDPFRNPLERVASALDPV